MRGLGGLFGPLALRGRTHDALAVRLFAAERCRYSLCFSAQVEQRLWFGMLGLHVINGVVFDYPRATPVPDGLRGISTDGPPGCGREEVPAGLFAPVTGRDEGPRPVSGVVVRRCGFVRRPAPSSGQLFPWLAFGTPGVAWCRSGSGSRPGWGEPPRILHRSRGA